LIFIWIALFALLTFFGLWRFMPEPVGQVKSDGERIERLSLSPRSVAKNYMNLLGNSGFMSGSIALGLVTLPCVAWIALAPLILMVDARLSLIEYGLWQIPLFGATLLGNWLLHRLTHRGTVKKILILGSWILGLGLVLSFIGPLLAGNYFIWLMPGLIPYFFGVGVVAAPLSRLILFSTPMGKGTASALMTLVIMCIEALGIEVANWLYSTHSNWNFGLFCALTACLYLVFLVGAFLLSHNGKGTQENLSKI
jgi:MFS transporter, DHA1 family, multidrug/chloramphenicol efflux transport protein